MSQHFYEDDIERADTGGDLHVYGMRDEDGLSYEVAISGGRIWCACTGQGIWRWYDELDPISAEKFDKVIAHFNVAHMI